MAWEFLDRFTCKRYLVRLVFKEPVQFPWFHGPAISALLCRAISRHPLGPDIAVHPVESGVIDFAANEAYHFGVTLFGPAEGKLERMAAGLKREGETPYHSGGMPRFEVASIDELPVAAFEDKTALTGYDLRLLTPLRMERKDPLKGKRFFDPWFFDGERFLRLLHDRVYDLAKMCGGDLSPYSAPPIPEVKVSGATLLWVDAPYHGGEKTSGGIIGTLRLTAKLDENWRKLLYLGQFAQAGRNTSMGFGKFACEQMPDKSQIAPARSLIDRIVDRPNLQCAFEHIKENDGIAGSDRVSLDDFSGRIDGTLKSLADEVKTDTYKPEPLQGVIVPKSSGTSVRALAVPAVRDRVLQRAACQVLGPSIDRLLEESSFAYRKGLSRKSAAHAIDRARREGYRFVLCSDINAFFDTVSWEKMERKLGALYREPALCALLGKWLRQDVVFQGRRIRREAGLPQGAAVSPLLANLYLDEFDEALGDDFKLIRYADDFVVLCRSEDEAKKALERAQETLKRLALEIKAEKTEIVDFEQGFQYLGYLFCRSFIMEKKKEHAGGDAPRAIAEDMIPQGSWLTHVDFRKVRALVNTPAPGVQEIKSGCNAGSGNRVTVYLSDPEVFVRLSGKTVELSRLGEPDAPKTVIPIESIGAVVDYGKPSMTMFALTELGKRGIPTYFCRPNGEVYLTVPGLLSNYDLWSRQERFKQQVALVAGFAKIVVCAKIQNYLTMCRRQEWNGASVNQMKTLEDKCASCADIETARGYEGRAAAVWFGGMRESIGPSWNFTGRKTRPPPDPVNAMLSFGYSCLYHHISTALQLCGLNPCIGWFHESRPNYHALACDLQEEFRHIVDSLVLFLIHRNMVTPDDFITNDDAAYPCLMQKEFRKLFLRQLEEKLLTEFTPDGEKQAVNYRDFFLRQGRQIQAICREPQKTYQPLRIR